MRGNDKMRQLRAAIYSTTTFRAKNLDTLILVKAVLGA